MRKLGAHRLRQNHIVARHLTLECQAAFNPPDGGVKEKHGLHELLREVRPIIPAAQVR